MMMPVMLRGLMDVLVVIIVLGHYGQRKRQPDRRGKQNGKELPHSTSLLLWGATMDSSIVSCGKVITPKWIRYSPHNSFVSSTDASTRAFSGPIACTSLTTPSRAPPWDELSVLRHQVCFARD